MMTKTQVPGRNSPLIVDLALEMNQKGLLDFFMDVWRNYGDFAKLQIGPITMFVVAHPDHVRHVMVTNGDNYVKGTSYDTIRALLLGNGLLTSTGDTWRKQRKMMAPFFSTIGIEAFGDIIIDTANTITERWNTYADAGTPIEMLDEMMSATATITLKALFSTTSDEDITALRSTIEKMVEFTVNRTFNPVSLPVWMPLKSHRDYQKARERVLSYIDDLIAQRRQIPASAWPDDVLSRLMQSVDEETGQPIADEQLRDEVVTLFVAGHETTAQTLTFAWYLLSQHPDVADRIASEANAALGEREPVLNDFKQMPYTLQAIKEALRLYPATPVYIRDAMEDDVIDGYEIPAGSRVTLLPYATHRHPDFWDQPEVFDPSRWEPEQEQARHRYAYHPFSTGKRICIGNNLSLLESQILVGQLAREFVPQLQAGHQPELRVQGTMTSHNGMPMIIKRRG